MAGPSEPALDRNLARTVQPVNQQAVGGAPDLAVLAGGDDGAEMRQMRLLGGQSPSAVAGVLLHIGFRDSTGQKPVPRRALPPSATQPWNSSLSKKS